MIPLSGLEFMTEVTDFLVQVSRRCSVFSGLNHERQDLNDEQRRRGVGCGCGLDKTTGAPTTVSSLIYIYLSLQSHPLSWSPLIRIDRRSWEDLGLPKTCLRMARTYI